MSDRSSKESVEFQFAWDLNEVLCEVIEGGADESRLIASKVTANPKIQKWLRATPAAMAQSNGDAGRPATREYVLRAMARNYAPGNSWDKLDAEACIQAADEMASTRAQLEAARKALEEIARDAVNDDEMRSANSSGNHKSET